MVTEDGGGVRGEGNYFEKILRKKNLKKNEKKVFGKISENFDGRASGG